MEHASISVSVSPKRLLNFKQAAAYTGQSPQRFKETCPVRAIELPSGDLRFDIQDLDVWINELKGPEPLDDDEFLGRLTP
jgi:hypothetical protein